MKGGNIRKTRSENFRSGNVGDARGSEEERKRERESWVPAYKQPRKHIYFRGLGKAKSYANLHPEEVRKRNKLQKKRPEPKDEKEGKEKKVKAVKSMFEMEKSKEKESRWARAKDFLTGKSGKGKEMVREGDVDDVEKGDIRLAL